MSSHLETKISGFGQGISFAVFVGGIMCAVYWLSAKNEVEKAHNELIKDTRAIERCFKRGGRLDLDIDDKFVRCNLDKDWK